MGEERVLQSNSLDEECWNSESAKPWKESEQNQEPYESL